MLVQRHPERAENWRCLGQMLLAQSPEEARDALEKARNLAPGDVDVLRLLAQAESTLGRHREAVAMLEQAIAATPGSGAIHVILANVFYERGDHENALAHAEQACQLTQEAPEAMLVKGNALHRLYRYDEALGVYDALSAKYPKDGKYLNNAGNVRADLGQQEEASNDYRKAIALMAGDTSAFSNYITTLHYLPASTREDIFRASTEWQALFGTRKRPPRPETPDKRPDRRLRIGMFSDGFRGHPVGWMITAALENLKPYDIELFAYSTNNAEDGLTSRIKAVATQWMSVRHLSDPEFAQRIRNDKIDILFDLCGHFSGTRMPAVVEEPAPLIVKWVGGLINTSGVPAIDYLLTDTVESPSGEDAFYTEKLIRMPDDYICYTPPAYLPPVAALPARSNGHITLGCFNNPRKINELVLAQWAQILHQLPNSRLFLKGQQYNSEHLRKKVADCLRTLGIDESRLIIEGPSNHQALLAAYNHIDIALDPWPYSGGLTTVEAMLMGVPVVTMPGPTFAGRHSATHLVNAGMPELVADDWPHYQRLVVGLANDLDNLATIRAHLRDVLLHSPVCDGARFAQHFSTAMRAIWQRYCQGKAPVALTLDKEGQAWFDGEGLPVEIVYPEAPPEAKHFSFSFQGRIIALDNGNLLAKDAHFNRLSGLGAISTIIFDPADEANPERQPLRAGQHHFPRLVLGDGEEVDFHACLDHAMSGTLPPLPAERQLPEYRDGAQVIARIPIRSQRLDDIEGPESIDWLLLDDRNNSLAALEHGRNALAGTLLVHARVSFFPTHRGQPELTQIGDWLTNHGFQFYCLRNLRHFGRLPRTDDGQPQDGTRLAKADAVFIPDAERLAALDENRRLKLCFILHAVYDARDLVFQLLNEVDSKKAACYLQDSSIVPAIPPTGYTAETPAVAEFATTAEAVNLARGLERRNPHDVTAVVRACETRLRNDPSDGAAFFVLTFALLTNKAALSEKTPPAEALLEVRLAKLAWQHKHALYRYWLDDVKVLHARETPVVSAVIIANKFKPDIVANIQELRRQGGNKLQIVFVNNGRPDSDFQELQSSVDVWVRTSGNSGAYLARNLGALYSDAPLLLFVDDDGLPHAGFLDAHLAAHRKWDLVALRGAARQRSGRQDPAHYDQGSRPIPSAPTLEGNASFPMAAFAAIGGWGDYILFGHGGFEISHRLLKAGYAPEQQGYTPDSVLFHEYFRGESHAQEKLKKQKISAELINHLHPDISTSLSSMQLAKKLKPASCTPRPRASRIRRPTLSFPQDVGDYLRHVYSAASVILEYGSGGSTILAGEMPGKQIFSVENDRQWAADMTDYVNTAALASPPTIYHVDVGETGRWAKLRDTARWRDFHHYPTRIWDEEFFRHPDTILIDGRFRVACFVTAYLKATKSIVVLFDDYRDRPYYHVVERLVKPTAMIGRMARFDLNPVQGIPREHLSWLIDSYHKVAMAE